MMSTRRLVGIVRRVRRVVGSLFEVGTCALDATGESPVTGETTARIEGYRREHGGALKQANGEMTQRTIRCTANGPWTGVHPRA